MKFYKRLFNLKEGVPLHLFSILIIVLLDIFIFVNIDRGLQTQEKVIKESDQYFSYTCRRLVFEKELTAKDFVVAIRDKTSGFSTNENCKKIEEYINVIEKTETQELVEKYYYADEDKGELKKILATKEIKTLQEIINSISPEIKKTMEKEYDKLEFWYPVKIYGINLLFLLPLLGIAFIIYFKKLKKDKNLIVLISSHLICLIIIELFIKTCYFLVDIIPKNLIRKFIELLSKFYVAGLWNYILIALGIIFAVILIAVVQHKRFRGLSQETKYFLKDRCINCGTKLRGTEKFCNFCGTLQEKVCKICGEKTYIVGDFCKNCGGKQEE